MIQVLVVDDSAFMRKKISDILNRDPEINVISTANSGSDAIKKAVHLKPDVITLDIEMPDIDGLTALSYIMHEIPTPVVIISGNALPGTPKANQALEAGAVAVVGKPGGEISLGLDEVAEDIIAKVKSASKVDVCRIRAMFTRLQRRPAPEPVLDTKLKRIVAIGASTGGPKAIKEIMPYFPEDVAASFLIVQHMPASFTRSMAERLNWSTKIRVKEAAEGDRIQPGMAYIAPGDFHMVVQVDIGHNAVIHLHQEPKVHGVRPSVSTLMLSVAEHFGHRAIGVVLTGMGSDGVEGMRAIKKAGGRTLAEDESSCVVFGMPRAAINEGVVDTVVPLTHMGLEIMKNIHA